MLEHFRARGYPEDFIIDSVKAFSRRNVEYKFRAPFLRSLFGDLRARRLPVSASQLPPPPPPPESRRSVSFLPEYVFDGGVNPDAGMSSLGPFEPDDAEPPFRAPTPPPPPAAAAPAPRRTVIVTRRVATRSQTVRLQRTEVRLDQLSRDIDGLRRSSYRPVATPPVSTPSNPNHDHERRELMTGLTQAICAAIELRKQVAQPQDPVALDLIRAVIESSNSQASVIARSVTKGVHQALLDVVQAIREQPQQLLLPETLTRQLDALPRLMSSFEQRLRTEHSLIEHFSSRMEHFANHIQNGLARLVTDEESQEVALIAELQTHSRQIMAFVHEAITDRNTIVNRLESGWRELHQCTSDFATHTLQLLASAPTTGTENVLAQVVNILRTDRECSHAELVSALQGQSQNIQQALEAFAASQEGLLRQVQAPATNPESAAIAEALDRLGRIFSPAVEQALKAHQNRPITLTLNRVEELTDASSRRTSRSRTQEGDGSVTIVLPPANAGSALGRAPSGAPDRDTVVLKSSRSEATRPESSSGPPVSFTTPGGTRDSCARCERKTSDLRSVELSPIARPGSQPASPGQASMRLLICDICARQSAEPSVARQDPSRGSHEPDRDPSPTPTRPAC